MIKRDFYLKRMVNSMWNGEVKVLTGIRRCGKSVLLFELFYKYLLAQGVQEDKIIKIELDQRRFYKYRNPIVLCDYVESLIQDNKDESFFVSLDALRVGSGSMQERSAGPVDLADFVFGDFEDQRMRLRVVKIIFQQARPATADAVDFIAAVERDGDKRFHRGVQSRDVATTDRKSVV